MALQAGPTCLLARVTNAPPTPCSCGLRTFCLIAWGSTRYTNWIWLILLRWRIRPAGQEERTSPGSTARGSCLWRAERLWGNNDASAIIRILKKRYPWCRDSLVKVNYSRPSTDALHLTVNRVGIRFRYRGAARLWRSVPPLFLQPLYWGFAPHWWCMCGPAAGGAHTAFSLRPPVADRAHPTHHCALMHRLALDVVGLFSVSASFCRRGSTGQRQRLLSWCSAPESPFHAEHQHHAGNLLPGRLLLAPGPGWLNTFCLPAATQPISFVRVNVLAVALWAVATGWLWPDITPHSERRAGKMGALTAIMPRRTGGQPHQRWHKSAVLHWLLVNLPWPAAAIQTSGMALLAVLLVITGRLGGGVIQASALTGAPTAAASWAVAHACGSSPTKNRQSDVHLS